MKIVFSVGGSLVCPDEIDNGYIEKLSKFINKLAKKHRIYAVVGGGKTARKYVASLREFKANEFFCDMLGIEITRINACLLISALNLSYMPYRKIVDASESAERIVIMGGTHPMHTTDGVAAMLAENVSADYFINLTNIDYVYDKDPNKFRDAKKLETVSYDELISISNQAEMKAGANNVLDLLAAKNIKRSSMKTFIINGKKLENVEKAIEGKKFIGTLVK
ncbi:MAG: UMP kinase [Candidatus Nealsonbacteria bacterium CG_4_8_14_3_um_filter_39_7]|uniref:Uridylate kinase n=1 Tax=Candidatus Nealsonbacteria bacterium CG23_combo_of_CG06-09_8_20_14_all_39_17 TaxID=1974722 RepID=A0A2G9YU39_9BACT|nr:MAG: UMP kinase [Candidatus Nealsonbacteria bacterium CG23_combo_of_CG06-09_8_20_14_all_39_17]PIU44062.1 MAG: UMP kinase [Candidatus Nealsonbacteria bacterium CG07_land_8_20_14_0_80_39_13]PIW90995.1 MAG: UMP kinase [Candidatus Nealsonbacteria bacterium CG_4_8_14_3_um_filter_39_7]